MDRLIYHNGSTISYFLVSPRDASLGLDTVLSGPQVTIFMLPLFEQFVGGEYIGNASEQSIKNDAFAAAGWWLIGTIYNPNVPPIGAKCDGFNYYATYSDHVSCLMNADIGEDIRYVTSSDWNSADVTDYHYMSEIPTLGISSSGTWSGDCDYWIVDATRFADLRSTFVSSGRSRLVTLDDGLRFAYSGLYQDSAMITGYFEYHTDNPQVYEVYSRFLLQVEANFTKIQGCWLGPEALQLFQKGMKFTTSVNGNGGYEIIRS